MGMVRRRTRRRTMMVAGGAAYAAGRRNSGQEQAYDEQAAPPAPPPPAPAEVDATSEIEKLASLHDSGALSDDEFAAAKQKVLGI
jgi:Short C-terminal domain